MRRVVCMIGATVLGNNEVDSRRARVKASILRWVDRSSGSARHRATMSSAIDVMLAELPNRDRWWEVMTIALDDTADMPISLRAASWRAYPTTDMLVVSTLVPGWSRGWHRLLPDEEAYDALTWFLHYARQYVHRSHVAKVLMVAWDLDGRILHPFGPKASGRLHADVGPRASARRMLEEAEMEAKRMWGADPRERRVRSTWARANTLDPDLHQAIFHFVRAHRLWRAGFELEAIVAFDCVLQAVKTLLMAGGLLESNRASRTDVCTSLGLGSKAGWIAEEGNFLRNKVGAHAGGWRWWDSGELTEDLVPALAGVARRVIGAAAAKEPAFRRVEPNPASWSDWLLVNFDTLWEIVWFEKLLTVR